MTTVDVETARLPRWLAGARERHGDLTFDGSTILAHDETAFEMHGWRSFDGVDEEAALIARAEPPTCFGIVLIRRGGYAVARVESGGVAQRKVGRRHVQSRTAAGGWSQQRFARRRSNQADDLVGAVRDHTARILSGPLTGVATGGDRRLAAAVLEDARLGPLGALEHRTMFDLPDPTPAILDQAVRRCLSVRIGITRPQ